MRPVSNGNDDHPMRDVPPAVSWRVSPLSQRVKLGLASLVVVMHVGLLLFMTRPPAHRRAPEDLGPGVVPMTIYDLRTAAVAQPPPTKTPALPKKPEAQAALEPAEEAPLELPPLRLDAEPIPLAGGAPPVSAPLLSATVPAGGDPCDLVPFLKAALEADTSVAAGLQIIPSNDRSVANAIMLWNGAWISKERLGDSAGIAVIRAALVNAVRAAPQACLSQPQYGPKLIPVADGGGTVVFAVGSGAWQWADILSQKVPDAENGNKSAK